MGRTKRQADPGSTPRPSGQGGEQTIRSYLQAASRAQTPQREMEAASQILESLPSTPARFSPTLSESQQQQQDGEWRDIIPNLLTKSDFKALSERLGRVVREEVAQLRADMANVEARMAVAETETRALRTDLEQTNTAVMNQEADITYLTTWVDDLDNRGRRLNLRVRGVREGGPSENVPELLRQIFTHVLGGQQVPRIGLVHAHRALRPLPAPEEQPRDIICCLDNYHLKEEILRTARTQLRHGGRPHGRPDHLRLPRFIQIHPTSQESPAPGDISPTTGRHPVPLELSVLALGKTRTRPTNSKKAGRRPGIPT
ncbi:Hypothetical predicted protein [Pelobates cultripes]|uniref:Uncharacterized protein n=1 Tax=Pelobates cultripes TaxID=61616 RepID=A0AAD1R0E1_PELCU|nr:Hypothetical predicted protein [Pelobates cultripes]